MRLEFLDEEHREQFMQIANENKFSEWHTGNREYASVLYLAAGNEEVAKKLLPYFSSEDGLDIDQLYEKEDLSSGIRTLVDLAACLFNGSRSCDVSDLAYLSERNFQLAIRVIQYRYGRGV